MTFEGLLLGLPKWPDGGPFTVQMRLAWQLRFGASVWAGSGGDREMRPKQEILFGVGSCRAIEVVGLELSIFPRVKITRERRRLAAALDCVHIIPLA